MSFRSTEIAVQSKTRNRLRLAVKLYDLRSTEGDVEPTARLMTVDELGDKIINTRIKEDYPLVIEVEKEQAAVEKRVIEGRKK